MIINQWRGRAWAGLSWLRIGKRKGSFVKAVMKLGFYKFYKRREMS